MALHNVLSPPSALLSFRAANVRSFRDDLEFSLLATRMGEKHYRRRVQWQQKGGSLGVLAVAGMFGANGSGKSNLLKAMADMRLHVLQSFRLGNPTGGMPRWPFLLDPACENKPSRYEVDVVVGGVRHEYGFVIDDQQVLEEWAYWYPKGRAALIFRRERDQVEAGAIERQKTRAVQEVLRPNALLLSTAASAKHVTLLRLHQWFEQNLLFADADSRPWCQALTTEMLSENTSRQRVMALLKAADLGITGARKHEPNPVMRERLRRARRIIYGIEEEPEGEDEPTFEELDIRLVHQTAGSHTMELHAAHESLGTRVWFGLIGPIVQAIELGSVLCVDELDASLHPALVAELIRLFQDPETNPQHAQLVFNSHDPTLLGNTEDDRLLGRDQVWFTEKLDDGSTRLYPLSDLEPRKKEAISKRYLDGRYGAIPILSHHELAAAVTPEPLGVGTN